MYILYTCNMVSLAASRLVLPLTKVQGPCVRVAPNEVHFADVASLKQIYSVRESYRKSPWYLRFAHARIENMFSTANVDLHRRYRRLLSGPIAESALAAHTPAIRAKVDLAILRMREEMDTRGAADVMKWWFFTASDVIGELAFGESFHALEHGKVCDLNCKHSTVHVTHRSGAENGLSGRPRPAHSPCRITHSLPSCG